MNDLIEFKHKKFGKTDVLVLSEQNRILFSNNFLKKSLDVRNYNLPFDSDTYSENDVYVDLCEVFEYIKYAKVSKESRSDFEEWLEEIIKECSKAL